MSDNSQVTILTLNSYRFHQFIQRKTKFLLIKTKNLYYLWR